MSVRALTKSLNEPQGSSQHQIWKLLGFLCGCAQSAPFSRLSPQGSLDSAISYPPGSSRVSFVYIKFSSSSPHSSPLKGLGRTSCFKWKK